MGGDTNIGDNEEEENGDDEVDKFVTSCVEGIGNDGAKERPPGVREVL
jgi:hypothetical protein